MKTAEVNVRVKTYPVMEHFATIQGEGFFTGTPAYFVRLGGCDVGCHWCDVKESWPMEGHEVLNASEVGDLIQASALKKAVITGGEPTMYDLVSITDHLEMRGIDRHIETSGVNPLTGTWTWVTFSPKKFKAPHPSIYKQANELKVVVYNKSDFEFAELHASKVSGDCKLYLQPEWSKRDAMIPQVIEYIRSNPKWSISLQTHKYMNIP